MKRHARHCLVPTLLGLLALCPMTSLSNSAAFADRRVAPSGRFIHLTGTFGWWVNAVEISFCRWSRAWLDCTGLHDRSGARLENTFQTFESFLLDSPERRYFLDEARLQGWSGPRVAAAADETARYALKLQQAQEASFVAATQKSRAKLQQAVDTFSRCDAQFEDRLLKFIKILKDDPHFDPAQYAQELSPATNGVMTFSSTLQAVADIDRNGGAFIGWSYPPSQLQSQDQIVAAQRIGSNEWTDIATWTNLGFFRVMNGQLKYRLRVRRAGKEFAIVVEEPLTPPPYRTLSPASNISVSSVVPWDGTGLTPVKLALYKGLSQTFSLWMNAAETSHYRWLNVMRVYQDGRDERRLAMAFEAAQGILLASPERKAFLAETRLAGWNPSKILALADRAVVTSADLEREECTQLQAVDRKSADDRSFRKAFSTSSDALYKFADSARNEHWYLSSSFHGELTPATECEYAWSSEELHATPDFDCNLHARIAWGFRRSQFMPGDELIEIQSTNSSEWSPVDTWTDFDNYCLTHHDANWRVRAWRGDSKVVVLVRNPDVPR
jgi:hypothetical protein